MLSSSPVETSYELLLQQQQLLLQCQLDWLHKYPQIILPAAQKPSSNTEGACSSSTSNSLGANVAVSQTQPTATSVSSVTSNGTQLGLITVTSNIANGGTGVTVNSLGSTTGTLLNVGNGSGTLVLTAQPSPSPVQSAVATVVPAPTPQTITVTLPAQQQQQAQVTLQPSLQVSQPALEPVQSQSSCITAAPQPSSQTTSQLPTTIKILGKLEDMKVSDLKMELKKRNLPVSGSKPQLIERIRNANAAAAAAADNNSTVSHGSPIEGSQVTQPMDIQIDVQMDVSHTSPEDTLTGFSADTPPQPSPPQPSPPQPPSVVASSNAMDTTPSSVNAQQMSPVSPPAVPSPNGSAHEMDTTPVSPSPSPVTREDLIREQQRQIKELQKQVKLLQSQQQLEMLRAKETNAQKPISKPSAAATIISANGNTGISSTLLDPSKAAVKQHLQNKIQQQQQQQLQVQQLQQQLQQQQLQQQQQIVFQQQQQQGINAKASLAAFLQQQQASSPSNNSNNNSNNNNINTVNNNNNNNINNNNNSLNNLNNNLINKKLSKTLVVQPQLQQVQQPQQQQQQQQAATPAAIVLNHINAQGKKGLASLVTLAGITGANVNHQRTNSLPNFLGGPMVQLAPPVEQKSTPSHQQRASSVSPLTGSKEVDLKPTILPTHRLVLTRTTTEPHILTLTTAPAAASSAASGAATIMATTNAVVPLSLPGGVAFNVTPNSGSKLPQYEEVASLLKNVKQEPASEKNSSGRHSVKSQIVDDVLDILIKSGELPPSAAQDPTTPTPTPSNSVPEPAGTNGSNLCGAFSEAQDSVDMFANVFSPGNVGSPEHSVASVQCGPLPLPSPSGTPPPPPPPPLPHTSFAVTLPTALSLTSTASVPPTENSFSLFGGTHTLDYILGSNGPPATSVDLKELGLDLETLDSMDFGQLDGSSSGQDVKLEPSDINMEAESEDMQPQVDRHEQQQQQQQQERQQHQQLAEQLLSTPSELMDICDMSEMDSDWLDSLMAPSDHSAEPSDHSSFNQTSLLPSSSSSSYIHMNGHSHTDIDSYDPLLSTNQDPLDLFSMDTMDSDFKMPSELGLNINWDKVDFAT